MNWIKQPRPEDFDTEEEYLEAMEYWDAALLLEEEWAHEHMNGRD